MIDTFEKHHGFALAQKICQTIQKNGGVAYFAGGCVRDALLQREAADIDIATSLLPEVVEKLFPKTLDVGKKFGTITVVEEDIQIEVTTFRKDLEYKNGRHPEGVEFCGDKEDAIRRDFTINALFYDLQTHKVIDHVGGVEDLRKKVLRAVGDPEARFLEDHLRILRGIRFQSQLGFEMESKTAQAIQKLAASIRTVSGERVNQELKKFVQGAFVEKAFENAVTLKLFEQLWNVPQTQKAVFISGAPEAWTQFYWNSLARIPEQNRQQAVEDFQKFVRLSKDRQKLLLKAIHFFSHQSYKIEDADMVVDLFDPITEWLFVASKDPRKELLEIRRHWPAPPEAKIKAKDLPKEIKGEQIGKALRQAYFEQLKSYSNKGK